MAERTDAEDEHDGTSGRQSRSFACLVVLLAVGMLTAGTVQTVSLKFQDRTIVDQETRAHFSHPAVQSLEMFIGEFLCLIPHLAVWLCTRSTQAALARQAGTSLDSIDPEAALELYFKQRSLRAKVCGVISFAIPAACDAFATTLLNVGLLLTFASVYQMLRGSLVLFTGLLAATVLRKKLHAHHWIGMMLILIGALIIGLVSVIQEGSSRSPPSPSPPSSPNQDSVDLSRSSGTFVGQVVGSTTSLLSSESAQRLIGDTLIVIAQLLMATQFVVEEKLMNRFKTPPLLAVGLEGFWGICMCGVALPLMSLFKQASGKPLESLPVAVEEISHNLSLLLSTITSIVAIAFFNGLGLFITRYLAAGTRATIDALRTISVYLVGLALDWEHFHWLEVAGFVVLFSGSCTYNKIIPLAGSRTCRGVPHGNVESSDVRTPLVEHDHSRQGWMPMLAKPSGHYGLARSVRVGMNAFSPSVSSMSQMPGLNEPDEKTSSA